MCVNTCNGSCWSMIVRREWRVVGGAQPDGRVRQLPLGHAGARRRAPSRTRVERPQLLGRRQSDGDGPDARPQQPEQSQRPLDGQRVAAERRAPPTEGRVRVALLRHGQVPAERELLPRPGARRHAAEADRARHAAVHAVAAGGRLDAGAQDTGAARRDRSQQRQVVSAEFSRVARTLAAACRSEVMRPQRSQRHPRYNSDTSTR